MHSNGRDFRILTREIERRVRWSPEYIEADRKLMWRPEFVKLLYTYLDVRPKMRVADIGSGTGFLARTVAPGIGRIGDIICIDHDTRLLVRGIKAARKERFSKNLHMVRANAYNCPLPTSWADLVMCQFLLSNVKHPLSIIREMARVTKRRGLVAAVEPVGLQILFDPSHMRLTELQRKSWNAYVKGYRKLLGGDITIGLRLPHLFMEAGLSKIELDGYLETLLFSDPRYQGRDLASFLRTRFFERPSRRTRTKIASMIQDLTYSCGGMSPDEALRIQGKLAARLKPLVESTRSLKKSSLVFSVARVIVRGKKL
jgi:ubiquinone/menaquinone biosynthesis C-methylase UbiE